PEPEPEPQPDNPGPALVAEPEPEPELEPEPEPEDEPEPEPAREGGISLATADFEDLRDLGLSVTQAKRVIRYRDERGLTRLDACPVSSTLQSASGSSAWAS